MSAIFGETLTFPQDNGPDVDLVVFGDEFYSRRETPDGFTVVYDPNLGQYCYARLLEGGLVSSGVPISGRPPSGLQHHLEESEPVRRQKIAERDAQLRPADTDFP